MMAHNIPFREIEESVMLQQRVFETVALNCRNLDVWSYAPAAVNRASAVREFHFVRVVIVFIFASEIVVIQRDVGIIALNQTSARRVVFRRSQSQPGIL